jgi:hypothetical protein
MEPRGHAGFSAPVAGGCGSEFQAQAKALRQNSTGLGGAIWPAVPGRLRDVTLKELWG